MLFMCVRCLRMCVNRTERSDGGEDAGATVSDQQVKPTTPRYPVDRYLVERSNKFEMVNITEDDIWNVEPVLRPEDEIVLRKLHDMLQSTADDLKLLSRELSHYHEPGVQVKSLPTPLDSDFNEKVHIEELVNAKFHNYNIVDKTQPTPANTQRDKFDKIIKCIPSDKYKLRKSTDAAIQVSHAPIVQKPKKINNLTISGIKTIQINKNNNTHCGNDENGLKTKVETIKPTVSYKELSFKYAEPKTKMEFSKPLKVQNMPSINIRSELKEQKVLQLNIEPEASNSEDIYACKNNIAVISVQHASVSLPKTVPTTNIIQVQYPGTTANQSKEPIRKFSKMSSCESSEVDSQTRINLVTRGFRKIRSYRTPKTVIKLPLRQHSEDIKTKKNNGRKKEFVKHSNSNLDIWKKKLNAVYGSSSTFKKSKLAKSDMEAKNIETKSNSPSCSQAVKNNNLLNNAEYIPYSKLTLGGARVSDIEEELSGIPNKHNITLGPILNKILSRENSFHKESPRVDVRDESPRILTTSDENLLREVIDIERNVTKTLKKNFIEPDAPLNNDQALSDDQDSYDDDFEDEKSDYSDHSDKNKQLGDDENFDETILEKSHYSENDTSYRKDSTRDNIRSKISAKTQNLAFKTNVDVFEFVHNIDTQDTGTQSNTTQKISLKQTQTSPRTDKCNVQPIYNDLWPSMDPKGEVEKLFQLEKDFIKKLIVDEYGEILEKNLNKPSTSTSDQSNDVKNVTASQKNTQTSPAHVKSVMTSPTRTKTRTTSPFALSLTVDQQTSPIREEVKITVDDADDLALSINLSSPRFSLRLPQSSFEVMSNLESHAQVKQNANRNASREIKPARNTAVSSCSSADGDYSSSDISSLGEVRFKLKRFRKLQVPTISELSSSTSVSKYSSDISDAIIPLRSEGEVSWSQAGTRKSKKNIKSEGEASVDR